MIANGTYSAKVIQVIETKANKGDGTTEHPVGVVTQYWTMDGKLLCEKGFTVEETKDVSQTNDCIK